MRCALCKVPAKTFCESDQAALCWDCDARVHGANFLVARHSRTLLCHACQRPTPWTASGAKLGHTVSVCDDCVNRVQNVGTEEGNGGNDGDVDNDDVLEDENGGEGEEGGGNEGEGGSGGGGDEDGENQVVPLSSMTPPPAASSSSSNESASRLHFVENREVLRTSSSSKRTREGSSDRRSCSNFSCQKITGLRFAGESELLAFSKKPGADADAVRGSRSYFG